MAEIPPYNGPGGYSNYPRFEYNQDPYGRPPGVYFDSIGRAWTLVQANLATWVLSMVIVFALYYGSIICLELFVFGGMITAGSRATALPLAIFPIAIVIGCVFQILLTGLMHMGLKQARNEQIGIGDIFSAFPQSVSVVIGMFVTSLIITVGIFLCIVPGLWLSGIFAFVPLLIADKNLTPIEALQLSYDTLKPHAWSLFALVFLSGLVGSLGGCLCGIGLLFTYPIYFVTIGISYNYFFPKERPFVFNQVPY